jgi:hypothetical protein
LTWIEFHGCYVFKAEANWRAFYPLLAVVSSEKRVTMGKNDEER